MSNAPAKKDFKIWVGNDTILEFRLLQDSEVPLDLTGSEVAMFFKQGTTLHTLSTTTGHITIDAPETGVFRVSIDRDFTRSIRSDYPIVQYEIERRIDDSQTTILYGNIKLEGGANDD